MAASLGQVAAQSVRSRSRLGGLGELERVEAGQLVGQLTTGEVVAELRRRGRRHGGAPPPGAGR